jgi:WW domain/Calpain family cysteine protease
MEWTGAWSDSDPRWTPQLKQELNYTIDKDDGLFWMEYSDFSTYFSSVDTCMIKHAQNGGHWFETRERISFHMDPQMMPGWAEHTDSVSGKTFFSNSETGATQWNFPVKLPKGWSALDDPSTNRVYYVNEETGHTTWEPPAGTAADFCVEAPIFVMVLPQDVEEAYFSVHQQDIRVVNAQPYIDFGVTVMRLNPATKSYELVVSSGNSADRQNQTEGMSLPAGQVRQQTAHPRTLYTFAIALLSSFYHLITISYMQIFIILVVPGRSYQHGYRAQESQM